MILRYLTQVTSFWCWLRWRMLVTNMVKTVTDILSSSPEYFVPSICHQHRFTHTNLSLKWYFETLIGSFLLFNYFLINIFFQTFLRLFLSSFGTIPISILIYIWFEMVASFFMLGVFTRDYRLYWNHLPYFVTEKKKTRFAIFLFFFALCGQIIVSFFVFGMANLRQESDINYRFDLVTLVP